MHVASDIDGLNLAIYRADYAFQHPEELQAIIGSACADIVRVIREPEIALTPGDFVMMETVTSAQKASVSGDGSAATPLTLANLLEA